MTKEKILSVMLSVSLMGAIVSIPSYAEETAETEASITEQMPVFSGNEENESPEAEAELSVAEESAAYSIEKDQTYSFENIGIIAYDITGLSNYVDYVIYYKDGSVSDYNWNQKPGTLSVPAGGKAIITSTSGTVSAEIADDYFLVEEQEDPVMKKVTIGLYETYTYTNTSNTALNLLSNGSISKYYDYVLYDADRNVTGYTTDRTDTSITIPAGYSIKITAIDDPITFNGVYEKFDLIKTGEPAMKKVVISAGETYTYTNTSNTAFNLLSNGSISRCYDYVVYDTEGNVSKCYHNCSDSSVAIPAGYSIKITAIQNAVTFKGVYEKFDLKKNSEPVMKETVISAGETYTYYNMSDRPFNLLSNGSISRCYDYVVYDKNGMIIAKENGSSYSSIAIPAGGKIEIAPTNNAVTFNVLYEAFDIENTNPDGKSYKITNTSSVDSTLTLNSGNSYDYAVYSADDTILQYGISSTSALTVPKGGYVAATVNMSAESPFAENEAFAVEDRENPVYKTTYLNPDETYKYTNNASRELMVYKNGTACDYIIYNADGSVGSYGVNSTDASFTVPIGGSICITAHVCMNIKGLYDYFTVEKLDNTVFNAIFCDFGETYQFTNNTVRDMNLLVSSNVYDYVIYNADNSVKAVKMNATSSSLIIPSGGKCAITPQAYGISVYALTNVFSFSERSYPVLLRVPLYYGETLTMNNFSDDDRSVYSLVNGYIDYVTYNAENIPQEDMELTTVTAITVPGNGRAEITERSSNDLFAGLYECFEEGDFSIKVTGITLSETNITLEANKQALLKAVVTPDDATDKTVTWSSSDTSVAVVAQTGKVTAKANGTATITAVTSDGGYEASCVVTVIGGSDPVATPDPEQPTESIEPTDYPYEIESLSIKSETGALLTTTPSDSGFIINVKFAKVKERNAEDYLFVAVYDTNGALLSLDYVQADFTENNSYSIGFHVPAQNREIGSVKAFVWNTFDSTQPLAEAKTL
ncbi:MAG: Ig-like domain-containing protein [Candidatus Ornithomonoglobus sp.]